MIESALTVHDDILQKELSSNADDKMKNIVATIQREQNRLSVMRKPGRSSFRGVAGSGKTVLPCTHRLLCCMLFRAVSLSKDILIVSPNKVFADYISNVLPELGKKPYPKPAAWNRYFSEVLNHKTKP